MVDRKKFIAMLTERYPAVAAGIDEYARGLFHLETGAFARAAQAVTTDEDPSAVWDRFRFIGEVYRRATPEVTNAIHVSCLEALSFDGKHGKRMKARELLSSELQAGVRDPESDNAELFGRKKRPGTQTPSKSTHHRRCSR